MRTPDDDDHTFLLHAAPDEERYRDADTGLLPTLRERMDKLDAEIRKALQDAGAILYSYGRTTLRWHVPVTRVQAGSPMLVYVLGTKHLPDPDAHFQRLTEALEAEAGDLTFFTLAKVTARQ